MLSTLITVVIIIGAIFVWYKAYKTQIPPEDFRIPDEVKRKSAIESIKEGKINEIAEREKVSEGTVKKWQKQLADAAVSDAEKIAELEKQIHDLTEENQWLQNLVTYYAGPDWHTFTGYDEWKKSTSIKK